MFGKKFYLLVFPMIVLVAVFADTAYAKSVYAINDTEFSKKVVNI